MPKEFSRTERVGNLIARELAGLLLLAQRDKAVGFVTVSHVMLSKDLAIAKVYVTTLVDEPAAISETLAYLNQQAKAYRMQLAKKMKLRITPELKFFYDEPQTRAQKINDLLTGLDIPPDDHDDA